METEKIIAVTGRGNIHVVPDVTCVIVYYARMIRHIRWQKPTSRTSERW